MYIESTKFNLKFCGGIMSTKLCDDLQKQQVVNVAANLYHTELSMSSNLAQLKTSLITLMEGSNHCVRCNSSCNVSARIWRARSPPISPIAVQPCLGRCYRQHDWSPPEPSETSRLGIVPFKSRIFWGPGLRLVSVPFNIHDWDQSQYRSRSMFRTLWQVFDWI